MSIQKGTPLVELSYNGAAVQCSEKFALCQIFNCFKTYLVIFSHTLFVAARQILVVDHKQPGQMVEK